MPINIVPHGVVTTATLDARYVLVAGDTMTGELTILPSSGDDSMTVSKQIIVSSGQKIVFDNS